jgi:hypothetical protein
MIPSASAPVEASDEELTAGRVDEENHAVGASARAGFEVSAAVPGER